MLNAMRANFSKKSHSSMEYGFRNFSFNKAFLIFVFVPGLNLSSSCASAGAGDPSDDDTEEAGDGTPVG